MTFLNNHPQGLATLFFTEMWERFSFYGMRALLVLYLVSALDYPRADALQIYATYTGLVYLTPIIGGYLADRYLGQRHAVIIGGIVMAMGHFAMAIPELLFIALGLLVAGNGFFKPNVSTIVGDLYPAGDDRRDSGFTLFYMGINLGGFIAPLVCSTLGEKLGWHYGFAAAGVGMVVGLLVFMRGRFEFANQSDLAAYQSPVRWRQVIIIAAITVALVLLIVTTWSAVSAFFSQLPSLVNIILVLGLLCFGALGIRKKWRMAYADADPSLARQDIQRCLAIVIIGLFVMAFWVGFEQAGGTMNLFAFQQTDRMMFGWEMPAGYFQSLNSMFILLLAPFFAMLWIRLEKSRFALSTVSKQAIGMIILGLGFVVLAIGQARAETGILVSPMWLVMVYLLHTIGELCLSPIGLSMITKLAPAPLVSMIMGLWFAIYGAASYLAGILESLLTGSGIPLYWFLVGISVGAGVLLLLISPLLHRLMHGVR